MFIRTSVSTALLVFVVAGGVHAASAPPLQIVAPHGGEVYFVGQTQPFLFTSKLKTITLELSRDGGTTYTALGPVTHNVYSFAVSAPVSNNCVIRASGTAGKTTVKVVSGGFAIQNPTSTDTAATPNSVVLRDGSGDFSANTITANLAGNASGSAASFTGVLAGDVTGPQNATHITALQGMPVLIDYLSVTSGAVLTLSPAGWTAQQPAPTGVGLLFGDGHDGAVVLASDTTLANDMYYSSLVVPAGVTLHSNGYRIFVQNTCEIDGTLDNSGGNGGDGIQFPPLAGASGSPAPAGSLGGGSAGGIGNGNSNGGNGVDLGNGLGGGGGVGGSDITTSGGTGGMPAAVPAAAGGPLPVASFTGALTGRDLNGGLLNGGTGGGGGSGQSIPFTYFGGGGGGGGGVVLVAAQALAGAGAIQARGGNGGNTQYGFAGGGGGGGGGLIIVLSAAAPPASLVLDVSGGSPGGAGNGSPPTAGAAGRVVTLY